jgi:hypothetical protein
MPRYVAAMEASSHASECSSIPHSWLVAVRAGVVEVLWIRYVTKSASAPRDFDARKVSRKYSSSEKRPLQRVASIGFKCLTSHHPRRGGQKGIDKER